MEALRVTISFGVLPDDLPAMVKTVPGIGVVA